jgi:hypothetical protein
MPVSRKRRLKGNSVVSDKTVMYGYESSATLTSDRLHYKCWGARYLSKNTVIFFLQLYSLILPLVGVCALSINRKGNENVGVRVIYRKYGNLLSAAVLLNFTASWRMLVIYTSKGAMKMLGARYLSKNTVIFFLQLYSLILLLVGVCALSKHRKGL